MSLIAWIVLGLIAGFIASKIVSGSGQGAVMDIVLGVVGAVIGGWLFNTFGIAGVGGFNLYSLFVAVVGASVLLLLYHAVSRGVR
ncbi:GlsB/YeaQ/YmgE family stress response membrane protein [Candidatus Accumulibacter sp. ACC003]|uniref:GlsB/YeaQ/YmgE family stress response membrane protein n=1 Tax=Candidatus Accumulibacter sp. ACC003 TaxID=2823334 RepID=UPI0025C31133|nr:GlsB/YeaQ/YmgE family stress response membrane protein [Candidatus Accumulibacter sp. ACC003]